MAGDIKIWFKLVAQHSSELSYKFLLMAIIPPSLKWPSSSVTFSGDFEALLSTHVVSFIVYAAATFLAITAPSWIIILLLYCRKKKTSVEPIIHQLGLVFVEAQDAFSQRTEDELFLSAYTEYTEQVTAFDAEYAEQIQFHEALMASIFSSTLGNNASSSMEGKIIDTELANLSGSCMENLENKVQNSSQETFCGICLENKESWKMFGNEKCSHSFCFDCTTNHILAMIHDRAKTITCPGINCNAVLNFDICRQMIPEDALVQWDEILCQSLIPESEKLYCPFRDCSTMLVNDTGVEIRKVKCVVCKRSFCASCRVPWHSEFTCKEFQKYGRKGGKDEKIVKVLAKKKKWQKCPKCKMYVEKAEGCVHITCRCKYEFCYTCGAKWTDSHNCQHR